MWELWEDGASLKFVHTRHHDELERNENNIVRLRDEQTHEQHRQEEAAEQASDVTQFLVSDVRASYDFWHKAIADSENDDGYWKHVDR